MAGVRLAAVNGQRCISYLGLFAVLPLDHDTTRHDPSQWHGNWAVLQLNACVPHCRKMES